MRQTANTVRIKRYPNRRFYDTSQSKYVSLQELEQLIRAGSSVEIIENQSGEDITRAILTQIILDRQPEKMALFPSDMLHCIVRANDVMAGFLRDYFQHSLTYLDYLQTHGKSNSDMANPMHWVKAWMDGLKPAEQPAATPSEGETSESEDLTDQIRRLEQRLNQLELRQANGSHVSG